MSKKQSYVTVRIREESRDYVKSVTKKIKKVTGSVVTFSEFFEKQLLAPYKDNAEKLYND